MHIWSIVSFASLLCLEYVESNDIKLELQCSVYEPNRTEECYPYVKILWGLSRRKSCFEMWDYIETNKNITCLDYAHNNVRKNDTFIKEPMQRVVIQYCSGTTSLTECFKCFNDAVDHLWCRNRCSNFQSWSGVPECIRKFENKDFDWSTRVILENGTKTVPVSFETFPYKLCKSHFKKEFKIEKDFNVSFPLRMPNLRLEGEGEHNVMLALFMNAFENNVVNGTIGADGFRCIDFVKDSYYSYYQNYLYSFYMREIRNKRKNSQQIITAYSTLRSDMCGESMNQSLCEKCFNEGDKIFLPYFKIQNGRITSLIDDFNNINTIYENCTKEYKISGIYTTILKTPHEEIQELELEKCESDVQVYVGWLKENPTFFGSESKTKRFKPIFDGTMFNVFSHIAYAIRHQNGSCALLQEESVGFMILYNKKLIIRLSNNLTEMLEDDAVTVYTDHVSRRGDPHLS